MSCHTGIALVIMHMLLLYVQTLCSVCYGYRIIERTLKETLVPETLFASVCECFLLRVSSQEYNMFTRILRTSVYSGNKLLKHHKLSFRIILSFWSSTYTYVAKGRD